MKKQLLTILTLTMFAFISKAQAQYSLNFDADDQQRLRYSNTTGDILNTKLNGATDYTIEVWVKPTNEDIHNTTIIRRYNQFTINLYDTKRFYFTRHYGVGGTTHVNTIHNVININEWNHIVVICSSADDSVKLYANGVDVTGDTDGNPTTQTALTLEASPSAPNLYIGADGYYLSSYFTGEIAKVRVKNTAENIASLQDDITDLDYVTDANTAILYNFKEGIGTVTENEADSVDATLQCSLGACTTETWWVDMDDVVSNSIETTSFNVYPNPVVDGIFTVQMASNENLLQVEMFDVLSKQVNITDYKENTTSATVDIANLKSGVYFVKIKTNKGTGMKKIIVD